MSHQKWPECRGHSQRECLQQTCIFINVWLCFVNKLNFNVYTLHSWQGIESSLVCLFFFNFQGFPFHGFLQKKLRQLKWNSLTVSRKIFTFTYYIFLLFKYCLLLILKWASTHMYNQHTWGEFTVVLLTSWYFASDESIWQNFFCTFFL